MFHESGHTHLPANGLRHQAYLPLANPEADVLSRSSSWMPVDGNEILDSQFISEVAFVPVGPLQERLG